MRLDLGWRIPGCPGHKKASKRDATDKQFQGRQPFGSSSGQESSSAGWENTSGISSRTWENPISGLSPTTLAGGGNVVSWVWPVMTVSFTCGSVKPVRSPQGAFWDNRISDDPRRSCGFP